MNQNRGLGLFWLMFVFIFILAWQSFFGKNGGETIRMQDYNEFLQMLNQNKFASVEVVPNNDGTVTITARERTEKRQTGKKEEEDQANIGEKKYVINALADPKLIETLTSKPEVKFIIKPQNTWLPTLLSWVVPIILFFFLWGFLMRKQMGGGINGVLNIGKSKAKLMTHGPSVTFADVAGVEEAKDELKELIQFLKDPRKFTKLGGRMPKGYLLIGRPGTGKTLLARAVAGEAGAPFFSITGSDFVEMFVGVGASRVRDMFQQAKANAPCIIFIDELDAIGKSRAASILGSHDEREQTLNQLLSEMDGFESNAGTIIMAATNRPEVLDSALLRPGRFDRHIIVPLPDIKGRKAILEVHARSVPLAENVDFDSLARGTAGFSGADLANLINEAALLAARNSETKVTKKDLELAKDRVTMGAERKSIVMSEKDKMTAAYHESGHTLIAKMLPDADPVEKVTIIPRGMALGFTESRPIEEKYTFTKKYLETKLAVFMGGRAAEEIIFREISTGAQNDIQGATKIAHSMVTEWGMSEKLGPVKYGENNQSLFLPGAAQTSYKTYSESTAKLIDEEIKALVETAYQRDKEILEAKRKILKNLAIKLLEKETINGEEIDAIIAEAQ